VRNYKCDSAGDDFHKNVDKFVDNFPLIAGSLPPNWLLSQLPESRAMFCVILLDLNRMLGRSPLTGYLANWPELAGGLTNLDTVS
jgi:hypothetical protein